MKNTLTEKCLCAYGRSVEVYGPDAELSQTVGAVISPLRYKNKMYLDGVYTDIGFNSEGHYLYIGPASCDLTAAEEGTRLVCDGVSYRIDRAEKVYHGDAALYVWAIIRVIVVPDEETDEETEEENNE